MKYFSLFIIIGLLLWSWGGYRNSSEVPVLTHIKLQAEIKELISDYIVSNVKGASNVVFQKLWTETTNTKEVRVAFEYSYDVDGQAEPSTSTTGLRGYAYLSPQNESSEEWSLDRVDINNQTIEFKNGSLVSPGTN